MSMDDGMTRVAAPDIVNWQLARDEEDLLWLSFDCADAGTNTLSAQVLEELGRMLELAVDERPRGLIVTSAKASGFAAGADIREFDQMTDADATAAQIDSVHALLSRIEALSFPTVARVHGFCLGGGFELALACRHIVAADDSATRLGFPEILLGIHPGFGGTVRSVRDAGPLAAMDLMLTGRTLNARRARKLGLIDRAVPRRHLDEAARRFARGGMERRKPGLQAKALSHGATRPLVAAVLRREVGKRASEAHYPAPYALIDLWRRHGGDEAAMYRAEARSIAGLLTTETSRNLVRMFKLQERLKALGRHASAPVRRVHVVGAGTMGGDIAAWCALRGCEVTLADRAPEYIAPAMQRAGSLFRRRVRDRYERLAVHDRLVPDFTGDGARRADVIIEAIVEDVDAKRRLFAALEEQARPDALLATNTSSIQLADIAAGLKAPERLVGVHFFNPVAQMRLVEIIRDEATDDDFVARACAFTTAIDRLPLPARSAPGFLINRVLSPYLQEAMTMLDEGATIAGIDQVARDFGMPMGPLELADTVGLDICLHVGRILGDAFGGEVPRVLVQKHGMGQLGKKSGRGFYNWKKGKPLRGKTGDSVLTSIEIRDRMILRLLNEAVACRREGIVADADLIDIGMVFGTGFAPFRGGPMHYAASRGGAEIVARLNDFAARYGDRFAPDDGWQDFT